MFSSVVVLCNGVKTVNELEVVTKSLFSIHSELFRRLLFGWVDDVVLGELTPGRAFTTEDLIVSVFKSLSNAFRYSRLRKEYTMGLIAVLVNAMN